MSAQLEQAGVRLRAILFVLGLGAIAYVLLQSLVVPALPTIQHDLGASTSGAAWIFTSFLIAAAVATPIAGRLGDMFGKKRVLIIVLAGLAVGTGMAAIVTTLPLMILARTIQGVGGAIFPLSFGIARDEFPREKVAGAIALLSGLLGVGGGFGIVLAGPIVQHLGWNWIFWLPCVGAVITLVAAVLLVPESPVRAPGNIHWLGAILLSGALVCLLLAISESPHWGFGDGKTLGLLGASGVLAYLWVRAELRVTYPLVDMAMMRLRGVWTTNAAGLLVGLGMFSAFVLIAQYVQAPESTGYGFGASASQAGLYVLPSPVMVMVAAPIAGRLTSTVGAKVPLVAGAAIDVLGFAILAVATAPVWFYIAVRNYGLRRRVRVRGDGEPDRRRCQARPDRRRLGDEHDRPHDRLGDRRRARRERAFSESAAERLPRPAWVHGRLRALRRDPRRRRRPVDARSRAREGGSGGGARGRHRRRRLRFGGWTPVSFGSRSRR